MHRLIIFIKSFSTYLSNASPVAVLCTHCIFMKTGFTITPLTAFTLIYVIKILITLSAFVLWIAVMFASMKKCIKTMTMIRVVLTKTTMITMKLCGNVVYHERKTVIPKDY